MQALRRLLLLLVTAVTLTGVGLVVGVRPRAAWADAPGPLPWLIQGVLTALGWAVENPQSAAIVTGVLVVPILLGRLAALVPRAVQKDPQRMFTADQRRSGFHLAGGQCEMEGFWLFTRCREAAAHGDHWFPWSKGGSTGMDNFVAACARCNTSKGAKVPTFWQTQRLTWRRRKYFPVAVEPTPGAKYVLPFR